jgi:hypothetical protein
MMKRRLGIIAAFLILTLATSSASASWMIADSYVYFDASGNLIGQSVLTCDVGLGRMFSGQQSSYWRQDLVSCARSALGGVSNCLWDTTPNMDVPPYHTVYPVGGWMCTAQYIQLTGQHNIGMTSHLPPGMTLEASCQIVGCDQAQLGIVNVLAPGAHKVAVNSTVPPDAQIEP